MQVRRTGRRFSRRLAAVFVITAAVVALAQFQFAKAYGERWLADSLRERHALTASLLSGLSMADGAQAPALMDTLLQVSSEHEDIVAITVTLPSGEVLRAGTVGRPAPRRSLGGAFHYDGTFATPAGPARLSIQRSDAELAELLTRLRTGMAGVVAIQALLGLPLFHVLGTRPSTRDHQEVVSDARRDPVTGLGNHRAFLELLEERSAAWSALVLLEVDTFHEVVELPDVDHADGLLAQVGSVLRAAGPAGRVFRVGASQFAVIAESGPDELVDALRQRLAASGCAGAVNAGIALRQPGIEPMSMWDRADAALQEARRRGGGTQVVYDDLAEDLPVVDAAAVTAVQALLGEQRLAVVYQPIVDLDSGRVLGYETLTRPDTRYQLSPQQAFDAAVRIGRVAELDALCRAAIFDDGAGYELPANTLLFINLHPGALAHPSLQQGPLITAVRAAGLAPDRVVFELTERTSIDRRFIATEAQRLSELGFKLALDDVGAGNAGLELLRHVPVDYVKIDQEVIEAAGSDPGARGVLHSICAFANQTGAKVIAEGIENPDLLALIRGLGRVAPGALRVHAAQGYHLGRPSPRPRRNEPAPTEVTVP